MVKKNKKGLRKLLWVALEVNCRNLASHLLSQVLKKFKNDLKNCYGITPWLVETFVDTESYSGTCYKAANWQYLGQTKGRGRNDRHSKNQKSVKAIYVYFLATGSFAESLPSNMIVAWRVMLLPLLGRECPDMPEEVVFDKHEILVMKVLADTKLNVEYMYSIPEKDIITLSWSCELKILSRR